MLLKGKLEGTCDGAQPTEAVDIRADEEEGGHLEKRQSSTAMWRGQPCEALHNRLGCLIL